MERITENNLSTFLETYHCLHDSDIENINYDIKNSKIEIIINTMWKEDIVLNEDNSFKTNSVTLKIIFYGVDEFNCKEMFSWDYISEVFLKFVKIKNKNFICFANKEKDPEIYIVCDYIEYTQIKN
ncbi:MAG: hypothetical protein J1F35_05030 [Erysipelotrichales bacterium]|nr:hypothetical protein [Erysipelotrichales bacterium]